MHFELEVSSLKANQAFAVIGEQATSKVTCGHYNPLLTSSMVLLLQIEPPAWKIEWRKSRLAAEVQLLKSRVIEHLMPQTMFHARVSHWKFLCPLNVIFERARPLIRVPTIRPVNAMTHLQPFGFPLLFLQLLRDVRLLAAAVRREELGELDTVVLATKLTSVGYKVHLRSALGGGPGIEAFQSLRNEFLIVAGVGEDEGIDYIVEGRFKSHFAIPHPTERYQGLMTAVPEELVAQRATLPPLVQLLCAEMSLAFDQQGLSLAPWRQSKSLLSKWLPSKARDKEVASPFGSPRAASLQASGELSAVTSGALTPSGHLEDDSPRAVLRDAREVLEGRRGDPMNRTSLPGIKPRSLLSADLAAAASPTACRKPPQSFKQESNGKQKEAVALMGSTAGFDKNAAHTAEAQISGSASTKPPAVGWLTPPIRRVRLKGPAAQVNNT